MTAGTVTTNYTYDLNNRLLENNEENGDVTTSNKFFYDYNGNLITKATMVNQPYSEGMSGDYTISNTSDSFVALYEYNCYNQLIGVDTNGVVSNYAYAPDGLRHSKTVGGNTITFVYDNANIVEEITADGTNKYYRGIEIIKNDDNLYYLYNGQGDVAFLIDSDGTSVADYVFDAYGNQLEENTIYNPFGYRGEYQDLCSGLIYLRNRYYDPSVGRFISEDPIQDGLNWYVYCNNDPVNRIDPEGTASFREKWDALWKVGPFDAVSINSIGNSTLIEAQNYALEKGLTSVTDNIADAYRHFSWNYDSVKKGISVEDVMQATTNHEVLTQQYMGKDNNGIKYYKVALSSLMDLQNNKAGRYQATLDTNKNKTSREVFERLASYGGVVISLEHVKQIWGIKDEWLYTATDGVRDEVSVLIKGGLKENALEIEVVNKNKIKFK